MNEPIWHKVDKKTFKNINAMLPYEVGRATACGAKNPNAVTWAWEATTCELCLRNKPEDENYKSTF